MPHINMVYPFVPESQFEKAAEEIQQAVASLQPFKVSFNALGNFEHNPKNFTMWAGPEAEPQNALDVLQKKVVALYPFCDDLVEDFHPHMTLGQFKQKDQMSRFSWAPISFTVNELYIISRTSKDPFTIKHTIKLGAQPSGGGYGDVVDGVSALFGSTSSAAKPEKVRPTPKPATELNWEGEPVEVQGDYLTVCGDRITSWLSSMNASQRPLPKTLPSLVNATTKMCFCSYRVTVEYLTAYLQSLGYITVSGSTVEFHPPEEPTISRELQLSREQGEHRAELREVQRKAREWCTSQLSPPKTKQGLEHALKQLTTLRRPVDPAQVIGTLDASFLTVEDNQMLTYHAFA
eukprot:TRINITY_DN5756_c0_g1_i1.p1 TRINITY_DN5756_c0_g1~~TRINITY_DN5756_c0_g1_i1.p1  ORF type:complete len:403 (-),score=92.85 TRINITY_DN5756_c0_g1_i1:893-1936(-)